MFLVVRRGDVKTVRLFPAIRRPVPCLFSLMRSNQDITPRCIKINRARIELQTGPGTISSPPPINQIIKNRILLTVYSISSQTFIFPGERLSHAK